ncbi:KpsF/GutQ family sugar-phosphate isomerase [Desulfatiglans anilini]|uniref:KpsF/GutQ family sugar-phosphate isomerase n=1 Tax=Desulfatiglans anilini TaxID=90728 RepID=UPI00041046B6|nr:KpsF/GutQ family sugar-phosphate isomerase [Desulfatiglans anilini]
MAKPKRSGREILGQARQVLTIEAESILALVDKVGPSFTRAIEMILKSKGRVILTGMGKSGLIARKIAATLNSTGTPALFLHPAEAIHGDLGMVTQDDIVLAISNSGQTNEINMILPILKQMGTGVIGFTGRLDSSMAALCDEVIDVGVDREACPMGLAPTASTTAALAMGDALAVVLINQHRFSQDDFRRFHPGGSLGERLSVKLREIMLTGDRIPIVTLDTPIAEAIREMNVKDLGATLVVREDRTLEGIFTDGDIRRILLNDRPDLARPISSVMTPSPKTVDEDQTTLEALGLMELYEITHLAVVDRGHCVVGIVHLHDLLGREEFKVNGKHPLP